MLHWNLKVAERAMALALGVAVAAQLGLVATPVSAQTVDDLLKPKEVTLDATPAVVVHTTEGPVRGTVEKHRRVFRGIPYAAPPTGARRWQPPAPPTVHSGVLHAIDFAPACPQTASPFGTASLDEDCLYLNVFVPRPLPEELAPVMVYIHGGAFVSGGGHEYDPMDLVDQGIVVVTINYRLGVLGFLAHPSLSAEASDGVSGNYGIMDQQRALAWVQQNIAAFGGDPGKVTIFGHSAGGLSVHTHLASPASAGLFQRAIAHSGAYALRELSLAAGESNGLAFGQVAGCSTQDAACLRALPIETVLAAQAQTRSALGYTPVVGGDVLPLSIVTALATGQFHRVPVIEGSTHDEFRLFVALFFDLAGMQVMPETYVFAISAVLGVPLPVAQIIALQYPLAAYPSPAVALSAIGTDAVFACPAYGATQLLSLHTPTFAYEFNDPDAPQRYLPPVSFDYGAYHIGDIQYLLHLTQSVPSVPFTADQMALSDTMVRYWATFAKHGNPNLTGEVLWPAFSVFAPAWQSLETPSVVTRSSFASDHKCAFWTALAGGA